MSVRHYRAQDAMTQLRNALPEHASAREASQSLCDPERYVVNIKFVAGLPGTADCLSMVFSAAQRSSTYMNLRPRMSVLWA